MTSTAKTRSKKIALIAAALLLLAFGWWFSQRNIQTTDDAYIEADVSVLSPEVEGMVSKLHFTAHQRVKAGDLLVQLDDSSFKTALAAAEATLNEAGSALEEAKANADLAATDLNRAEHLASTNAGSRQSLDDARIAVRQATARIDEAQARIALATAQRDQAKLNLEHTTIRAPFDGQVGEPAVQPGTFVRTGAQLVMLVPKELHVTANFKETQISRMKVGQHATLRFDSLPGAKYIGTLSSLSPGTGSTFALLPPENATGNFTKIVQRVPVRISLPDDPSLRDKLRAGLSVEVSVDISQP